MDKVTEPAKLKAATTYNAAADHFDDGPLAFWDRYGRKTIERLRLEPGSIVLDVGCGSGASAIPAAKAVGPYGRVIGADLAERLLVMAQAKADAQKLTNATFRQADMENLGYSDDSFDAVVCVFAIFFVPDMVKQVRELWRMVRAGGQLAITTWGPRMFEPGSAAWWAAVKQFRPDLHAAFNPWERIITPQAVRQLLTESGIENADVTAEDGQQALQSPEDWWTVVLGSGYRWTLEQMDHETAARVREVNLTTLRANGIQFNIGACFFGTSSQPSDRRAKRSALPRSSPKADVPLTAILPKSAVGRLGPCGHRPPRFHRNARCRNQALVGVLTAAPARSHVAAQKHSPG